MNEKQIKAMADCAGLLHENGISRNFFYEVLLESFSVHEWMGERLGLNEKNNYRINVPIPPDDKELDTGDEFILFAMEICRLKESVNDRWTVVDKTFVQDSKRNKYKITRLLNLDLWKQLVQTENGLMLFSMSKLKLCCAQCTLHKNKDIAERFVDRFNVWYGDQAKSDRFIVLSCHPLDILRASENASFKSCYKFQGDWFNGIISSMLSPNTLIASIEEKERPGYKVGRSWIYVNEDQIVTGRKYGGITDLHHLHIRSFLYSRIGKGWVHKKTLSIRSPFVEMLGPGYLDIGHGTTAVRKKFSSNYTNITPILIPMAICLFCGSRFNDWGRGGICRLCASTVTKPELER